MPVIEKSFDAGVGEELFQESSEPGELHHVLRKTLLTNLVFLLDRLDLDLQPVEFLGLSSLLFGTEPLTSLSFGVPRTSASA